MVEGPRSPLLPFPDVLPFYQSPAGAASIYEKVSRDLTVDEKMHARNIEQRSQFDQVKVVVGCGIGAPTRIRNGTRGGKHATLSPNSKGKSLDFHHISAQGALSFRGKTFKKSRVLWQSRLPLASVKTNLGLRANSMGFPHRAYSLIS